MEKLKTLASAALVLLLTISAMAGIFMAALQAQANEQAVPYGLTLNTRVSLAVQAVDASDEPTDAPCVVPTWSVSDPTKAALEPVSGWPMGINLLPKASGLVSVTVTCGAFTQVVPFRVVGPAVAIRVVIGPAK
jgi:hypothetical protein